MALTLVEAAKYSNDVLQKGVIQKMVRNDPILERIKFRDIPGNGLTYDVESTEASASFYAVGGTWTEGTHEVAQTTASLKILGGDVDVDNFLKKTRSNINDLQQEAIDAKVKAVKKTFMDKFYYGYSTTWTNEFDGLHYLIRSVTNPYENTWSNASVSGTPVAMQMNSVDTVIDYCKGAPPSIIISSHSVYRMMSKYMRGIGGADFQDIQGRRVFSYDGIPWERSHYISDDESCDLSATVAGNTRYVHNYADGSALADDDNSSTLFVISFDTKGVEGLQAEPIQIEKVGTGNLETKDATRHRIKWYCSLMLQNILCACKYSGIAPTTVATA